LLLLFLLFFLLLFLLLLLLLLLLSLLPLLFLDIGDGGLALLVAVERFPGPIVHVQQQLVSIDFEIAEQAQGSQRALLVLEARETKGARGVADGIHHALPVRHLTALLQQTLDEIIGGAGGDAAHVDGRFDADEARRG
jgi:hypothetical protein